MISGQTLLKAGAWLVATGLSVLLSTALAVVLALTGAALLLIGWRREQRKDPGATPLAALVQTELVATIDQGEALGPDVFSPPDYATYVLWRDKAAAFLRTVFGEIERQRFNEPYEPRPTTLDRNLKDHLRRLADLRDRPATWELQVNAEGLRKAAEQRRHRSVAERITLVRDRPAESSLSFGRAEIPKHSQRLTALDATGQQIELESGRIIRVPVINSHGAAEAKQVHARLRFLTGSGEEDRQWTPRPTQGEWSEHGRTEIDMSGNGRPHLLDVVAILDGEYPHGYEWTTQSRAAGLAGYGIYSRPFRVEVEILGAGVGDTAPRLCDTLEIECSPGHMIHADWLSGLGERGTNWVTWQGGR